jgi:serine-type D-Ala-D-Ala carboxypeptidase
MLLDGVFGEAERLVAEAVEKKGVPGAILWIEHRGKAVCQRAFGFAGLLPETRPATLDTIFDLASLTKPIATGTALGLLLQTRQLNLDDPVGRFLPEFVAAAGDREKVTIRHLATHCAGLPAGGAYANKSVTLSELVRDIASSRRVTPPGQKFLYSDFSAITLGAVIEVIAGETLDRFCQREIFAPLKMTDTRFRPGVQHAPRCAATMALDLSSNRGRVHDPTAAAAQRMGDVTGHAGLFSTASDLAVLARLYLSGGGPLLKSETVALLTTRQSPFDVSIGGDRGVLWDLSSPYAIRGELSNRSFGHTGFTGTSIWIDPKDSVFVILLTNAVHAPKEAARNVVIPLRRQLSTAVARAIR